MKCGLPVHGCAQLIRSGMSSDLLHVKQRIWDRSGTVINEITLGCGPAGEARYPAYPEGDRRWRFPGVGEFQCYDGDMLKSLRATAEAANRPEWGYAGPHDSGTYCSRAEQTGFFHPDCGNWRSEYGHFFLSWYSGLLINHVDKMVAMGNCVLSEPRRPRLVCISPLPPPAHALLGPTHCWELHPLPDLRCSGTIYILFGPESS